MDKNHHIRPASQEDIPDIQDLLRLSWHAAYDNILGHDKVTKLTKNWHSHERLNEDLIKPNCQFLVLTIQNEICATSFVNHQGKEAILSRMYILPKWQHNGLGTELMNMILASIGKETCISLTVEPQNSNAIQFYKNFYFEITGPGSCSEDPHDDIPTLIMRRTSKCTE